MGHINTNAKMNIFPLHVLCGISPFSILTFSANACIFPIYVVGYKTFNDKFILINRIRSIKFYNITVEIVIYKYSHSL